MEEKGINHILDPGPSSLGQSGHNTGSQRGLGSVPTGDMGRDLGWLDHLVVRGPWPRTAQDDLPPEASGLQQSSPGQSAWSPQSFPPPRRLGFKGSRLLGISGSRVALCALFSSCSGVVVGLSPPPFAPRLLETVNSGVGRRGICFLIFLHGRPATSLRFQVFLGWQSS